MRYVWRHLPLSDVHPNAERAPEASEAAAAQDAFWAMHDLLLEHQPALQPADLMRNAAQLELDVERFTDDLRERSGLGRISEDVDGADLSGVSGTPTFFINGRRHRGRYDIDTLSRAVRAAGARDARGAAEWTVGRANAAASFAGPCVARKASPVTRRQPPRPPRPRSNGGSRAAAVPFAAPPLGTHTVALADASARARRPRERRGTACRCRSGRGGGGR